MTDIESLNIWGFYGFFFSNEIRRKIEKNLLKFEKTKIEEDNWPPKNIQLQNVKNCLTFTFTYIDKSEEKLEIKMDEEIFSFPTILNFCNVEYYRILASAPCRYIIFYKYEKQNIQKLLVLLEEGIDKV